MAYRDDRRIQITKRRYGAGCYKTWGKRGGSPILNAIRDGKRVIIKSR